VWVPRFVCPECRTDLAEAGAERFACAACGRVFDRRAGGWRFLTATRGARLEPFVRQYRIVRQREGRRQSAPDYYRRLPTVAPGADARDWEVTAETYHHLLGHVLARRRAPHPRPRRREAWLSHRLARSATAPSRSTRSTTRSTASARRATSDRLRCAADFDVAFAPSGSVVVFSRSLHYAADTAATLSAYRVLAPGAHWW
jgi:hypothetical protein